MENTYCVPYVVSKIVGVPAREIEQDILRGRANFNRKKVTGVGVHELIPLLHSYGRSVRKLEMKKWFAERPTVQKFVENLPMEYKALPVIIIATDHALMTQYGMIDDNHSKRFKNPYEHENKRMKVLSSYLVL